METIPKYRNRLAFGNYETRSALKSNQVSGLIEVSGKAKNSETIYRATHTRTGTRSMGALGA
jgi:hypothetical protein